MAVDQAIIVTAESMELDADLTTPHTDLPLVLFAHGSGSSRGSPRNRFVAERLAASGLGTLLLDLLTPAEALLDETTRALRFDIGLLTERLIAVTDWAIQSETATTVAYFGASTGAAAALAAAAERPDVVSAVVSAVVSRGGRPDLAAESLARVRAPTLLIVGGRDLEVLELNRTSLERLDVECRLEVIPGATHLFEEPGALERVAELARDWFLAHSTI